jgi:hypothetical protein
MVELVREYAYAMSCWLDVKHVSDRQLEQQHAAQQRSRDSGLEPNRISSELSMYPEVDEHRDEMKNK